MIDAEEAEARTHRAADENTEVEQAATEKDTSAPKPVAESAPSEVTEDLPVFAWLQGVESAPPTASDWTRELVRAKEARADEPGRT